MGIQRISQAGGGFAAAVSTPSGNNVATSAANFADSLAAASGDAGPTPQEIRAAQTAHMYARIAAVGLARYVQEEQDKTKMLRVLAIIGAQSPADEQGVLEGIADDFLRNPPNGLQDMYARIDDVVKNLSAGGSDLSARMAAVVKQIHQMMDESDDELARREKAANIAASIGW